MLGRVVVMFLFCHSVVKIKISDLNILVGYPQNIQCAVKNKIQEVETAKQYPAPVTLSPPRVSKRLVDRFIYNI